jgi:hypothetical protein
MQQDFKIRIDMSPLPPKKSTSVKRGRRRKTPEAKEEAKNVAVPSAADSLQEKMVALYAAKFELYKKRYQLYYGPKTPE